MTNDTTKQEAARDDRRTVVGTVISAKMKDTIVVREDRSVLHPLYKKYVRRSTKYYAHDAGNTAGEGDVVEIMQTRPISKTKNWRLVNVVRRGPGAVVHADTDIQAVVGPTAAGAEADTAEEARP